MCHKTYYLFIVAQCQTCLDRLQGGKCTFRLTHSQSIMERKNYFYINLLKLDIFHTTSHIISQYRSVCGTVVEKCAPDVTCVGINELVESR